ncbi:MAG: hypothetical protein AAF205_09270 [Pseudomonadota bacterium]
MRLYLKIGLALAAVAAPLHAQDSVDPAASVFANPLKGDYAAQSSACREGPMAAFGRYLGSYDFQDAQIAADGSWTEGKGGQWDFFCLGEGIAVQDFWQPNAGGYGATMRMYNAETDAWDIVFTGEGSQAMSHLSGTLQDDGTLVMYYITPTLEGIERRITFSPPTEAGFDWMLSISRDGRKSWVDVYRMTATRR